MIKKIAIVHDDLVQWGGAERVLEAISEIYPDAPIYTSVFDTSNKALNKRFGNKKIITSFIQQIPFWRQFYKPLLPLYPIAFEQFDFSEYDLVISHTTRFAKSVITKPETLHISYCHTPPRFLWNFSNEIPPLILKPFLKWFRIYDQISAKRVDSFLAGSKNARNRIRKIYEVDSRVVYPFVDLKRLEGIDSFNGEYFVVIARLNKYKRVDLVVKACMQMGISLKVIGAGPELETLKRLPPPFEAQSDVQFLENLSDEMVVKVLAGAKGLIIPGAEDFGMTSIEAQALGKPVIAYKAGGALETVIEGQTGIFFEELSIGSLIEALQELETTEIDPEKCRQQAKKFSKENFIKYFKESVESQEV